MENEEEQRTLFRLLHEREMSKRGISRRTMTIWLAGIVSAEVLASGITWSTALHRFQTLFSKATLVSLQAGGQAFFLSTGQVSINSSIGIEDNLQMNLDNIPSPSPGKDYFVYLLGDGDKNQNPELSISLQSLSPIIKGTINFSYSGGTVGTNLLATTSRLVITEEDPQVILGPRVHDKRSWRYYGEIAQVPNPTDTVFHYSVLDHIRHLLSQDPQLQTVGLIGGLDIWLFRNTFQIMVAAGSIDDTLKSGTRDALFMYRQLVKILNYIHGIQGIEKENLPTGVSPLQTDPLVIQIGLLESNSQQNPSGYLKHISIHLISLTQAPGVTPQQKALAIQMSKAIDNVESYLIGVHDIAITLVQMSTEQLFLPETLPLINHLITLANCAVVGQIDQNTNQIKEGVTQIHYNMQLLATFEVKPYLNKQQNIK